MTPVLPPPGWSIFSAPLPRESDLAAVNDRVNSGAEVVEIDERGNEIKKSRS